MSAYFPSDTDRPWGWQDPAAWRAYGKWMHTNGLIKQLPRPQALNNDLLPVGRELRVSRNATQRALVETVDE